jgi:hypothetical protein
MGILRNLKVFEKYVSPEVLAKLGDERQLQVEKLELKHFQFVIVLVNESGLQEVPAIISLVVGTLLQHKATLSSITSTLLVGVLGVPFPDGNSPEARQALVDALLRENGDGVRIAHGQCDGMVGLLGTKKRWNYGQVIPGFSETLKKLLETQYGMAVEIGL